MGGNRGSPHQSRLCVCTQGKPETERENDRNHKYGLFNPHMVSCFSVYQGKAQNVRESWHCTSEVAVSSEQARKPIVLGCRHRRLEVTAKRCAACYKALTA